MKIKLILYSIVLFLLIFSAIVINGFETLTAKNAEASEATNGDSLHILADYVEILIDVSTIDDLKRYEKTGVPKENIPILMKPRIRISINNRLISGDQAWDIIQISNDVFQFKYKTLTDCFFQADLSEPAVYKITNTEFGHISDRKEPLYVKNISRNNDGDWVIHFPRPYIRFDVPYGKAYLFWKGIQITEANDFQIRRIEAQTFQLHHRSWNDYFWEIDFHEKEVWGINNGTFGKAGGSRYAIQGIYPSTSQEQLTSLEKVKDGAKGNTASALWPSDIALDLPNNYPDSHWQKEQANLFLDILSRKHYDTLLLPLQVDGYAIDHAGRFLITLMIHQRLQESGFTLPNPILLTRALGEEKRTLSQERVFQLASQLGAKEIIVPMAGHNSRNELNVRFLKLIAAENGQFSDDGKFVHSEKNKIPFSDSTPPSLVVAPLLNDLLSGISIELAPPNLKTASSSQQQPSLPNIPVELFEKDGTSPLENALLLQLFGILHPNSSFATDGLFGRSLLAAWELPPQDPKRPLLIARALFYLHRRPAALEALGKPRTPEEQAFFAYLNGDLISLENAQNRIVAPLPKLMANIEYQDLLIEYTGKPLDEETLNTIVRPFPGWENLIARKLLDKWRWAEMSNLAVKEMMDQAFPIERFTAQGLASSRAAMGKSLSEGSEVELCAYEHYKQILKKEGTDLYGDSSIDRVNASDLLQLLYEISEGNLIDTVYKSVWMRGLADEALEKIRRYDPVYKGLPTLTYLESEALRLKARTSRGTEQSALEKEARQLKEYSAMWGLEQVSFAYNQAFDQDFPKRYNWHIGGYNNVTTDSLENSLIYSNEKFNIVKRLCQYYDRSGYEEQMYDLVSRLETRFVGQPDRQILLANFQIKKGNMGKAKKYLQQAVAILPDTWEPHAKLVELAIHDGQLDEAAKIAHDFQPFAESEPANGVALSAYAFNAAMEFYLLGEVDKASPFFEIAQKFQTGSSAEMLAAAYMGLVEEDYQSVGQHFLMGARRYTNGEFISGYLKFLQFSGLHDQAWSVFNNLPPNLKTPEVYAAALYGMRIEGKSDQEMMDWIGQQDQSTGVFGFYLNKIIGSNKAQLADILDKGVPKPKNGSLSLNAEQAFMQTYLAHRTGAYEKGDRTLLNTKHGDYIADTALPYAPYYFYHSGQLSKFRSLLAEYKAIKGTSYFEYFAEGVVAGLEGKTETALKFFRKARLNVSTDDTYHLPPLYQLAETCELFYEQTKDRRYLDAALSYARWHNRQDPTAAWPYTFLAKYSPSSSEKINFLGRAVYLAPDSDRIKTFSQNEKEKALRQFENNNVFTRQPLQSKQQKI